MQSRREPGHVSPVRKAYKFKALETHPGTSIMHSDASAQPDRPMIDKLGPTADEAEIAAAEAKFRDVR